MIDARHRNTAFLVAGCFFMENLDGTIVTTAAPKIGQSLHVPAASVGLVITAYLLTLAILIPASGWLTRRFGTRPVFLSAIAVFTLASLGCALSGGLTALVILRVVQGIGGAMMVPVGRTAVVSQAEKQDLMRIISYIVWPALISPVIAPIAGALITTYASWPWLFGINVPLGIVAWAVAWRLIESEASSAPPPLDWLGLLLTCTGLGGLTYDAYLISETGCVWVPITALGLGALGLLVLATAHLLRTEHPLLTVNTLQVPTFRLSQLGGFLFWLTVGAGPFLLPLLFQNVFSWSAIKSGAVVLFIFVGNIGIKPATTPLLNRFGFRPVLLISTSGLAATMLGLGFCTARTPLVVIAVATLSSGIFRSTGLTAYNTIALSDIPAAQMRDANTLAATTSQLSGGLAIAAAIIALRLGSLLGPLITGMHSPATTYLIAFVLVSFAAIFAAIKALQLDPQAGSSVRRVAPGAVSDSSGTL